MFTEIRNTADTNGFRFFLIVIVLSFIVWGVGDVIRGARSRDIVFLKHTDNVSIEDFAKERYRIVNKLQQQGQDVSPQLMQEVELSAVENLIQQKMMAYIQQSYELDFSDQAALNYLKQDNPSFDNEALKQHLKRNGISEDEFFADIKKEAASQVLSRSFVTGHQPKILLNALQNYYAETDHIISATIDLAKTAPAIKEIDSKLLTSFYEENKSQFQTQEIRDLTFLTIDNIVILKKIKVTDQEITDFIEEQKELNSEYTATRKEAEKELKIVKAESALSNLRFQIEEDIIAGDSVEELMSKHPLTSQTLTNVTRERLTEHNSIFSVNDIFEFTQGDIEYPTASSDLDSNGLPTYQMVAINKIIPSEIPEFDNIIPLVKETYAISEHQKSLLGMIDYMQNNPTSLATFKKQLQGNKFDIKELSLTRSNIASSEMSTNLAAKILEGRKNSIYAEIANNTLSVYFLKDIIIDKDAAEKLPHAALANMLNSQNIQEVLGYAAATNTPEVNVDLLQQISSAIEN